MAEMIELTSMPSLKCVPANWRNTHDAHYRASYTIQYDIKEINVHFTWQEPA